MKWLITPTIIVSRIAGHKSSVARMELGRCCADRLLRGSQSEVDDVDADNKCGGNCRCLCLFVLHGICNEEVRIVMMTSVGAAEL